MVNGYTWYTYHLDDDTQVMSLKSIDDIALGDKIYLPSEELEDWDLASTAVGVTKVDDNNATICGREYSITETVSEYTDDDDTPYTMYRFVAKDPGVSYPAAIKSFDGTSEYTEDTADSFSKIEIKYSISSTYIPAHRAYKRISDGAVYYYSGTKFISVGNTGALVTLGELTWGTTLKVYSIDTTNNTMTIIRDTGTTEEMQRTTQQFTYNGVTYYGWEATSSTATMYVYTTKNLADLQVNDDAYYVGHIASDTTYEYIANNPALVDEYVAELPTRGQKKAYQFQGNGYIFNNEHTVDSITLAKLQADTLTGDFERLKSADKTSGEYKYAWSNGTKSVYSNTTEPVANTDYVTE